MFGGMTYESLNDTLHINSTDEVIVYACLLEYDTIFTTHILWLLSNQEHDSMEGEIKSGLSSFPSVEWEPVNEVKGV